MTSAQFSSLFKFLQGLTHIWDMHELGLVKKERQLQDLLQECRQENDTQNQVSCRTIISKLFFGQQKLTGLNLWQKREEKLDSILDQMRESSSEKDLKRLLSNVSMQLEAIKRGYETFHDAQIEIVRNYPEMVVDELKKYKNALYKFFSIKHVASSESAETGASSNPENGENSESAEPVVDIVKILEDMQDSLKEVLTTSTGAKYYITQQPLSTEQQQPSEAVDGSDTESSNDILGYDELIPNTKPEFARKMQFESHLKNTFISADQLIEAKKLYEPATTRRLFKQLFFFQPFCVFSKGAAELFEPSGEMARGRQRALVRHRLRQDGGDRQRARAPRPLARASNEASRDGRPQRPSQ